MDTMNISVTSGQTQLVDSLTRNLDFANRSEFFRALLRLVERKPEILQTADELLLESPTTRSVSKIIRDMKTTGKYSSQFLTSLKRGLEESQYFTN